LNIFCDASTNAKSGFWESTIDKVKDFLETSDIVSDIKAGINERFIFNAKVLEIIQKLLPSRLEEASLKSATAPKDVPPLADAQHFMKFATAAYGGEMIHSCKLALDDLDNMAPPYADIKEVISCHVKDIKAADIVYTDMDMSGSSDYLRHFVAIDHNRKSIVFAIRGTFSISSAIVDLEFYASDFCGGFAHTGIAKMAKSTWEKAQPHVTKALNEYPDYRLVITGHSLGAGVACLINILIHNSMFIPPEERKVSCFAYAPPPVFYPRIHPDEAAEAVQDCYAYVNKWDVVPQLSVDNVRRVVQTIASFDKILAEYPAGDRIKFHLNHKPIPEALVDTVRKARSLPVPEKEGAPTLSIPAKCIVWMHNKDGSDKNVTTSLLDPVKYAERVMDFNSSMIDNHMAPNYEASFKSLVEQQSKS
jgi:hypothetical protein